MLKKFLRKSKKNKNQDEITTEDTFSPKGMPALKHKRAQERNEELKRRMNLNSDKNLRLNGQFLLIISEIVSII